MTSAKIGSQDTFYCLVDCNNFYVSCERVFNPKLRRVPVVVLSNGDGCIVSRSQEAKDAGIPMAAAVFEYRKLIEQHGVQCLSSNYTLYGDMSARVIEAIQSLAPEVEQYSIDEAFLRLTNTNEWAAVAIAREIRERVYRWTGIPVSIGIAKTKTLAKIANEVAKRRRSLDGVHALLDDADVNDTLKQAGTQAVWGIGPAVCKRLWSAGIKTAYDLKHTPENWILKTFSICQVRTVRELNGIPCVEMEDAPPPKKEIVRARSFDKLITSLDELREAIASYTARAAEKLREEGSAAGVVGVYIRTSYFRKEPFFTNEGSMTLPEPTSYTPDLIRSALAVLGKVYRQGPLYKKAGVMMRGIVRADCIQRNLFEEALAPESNDLMAAIDRLQAQYGKGLITYGSEGLNRRWKPKRGRLSGCYTTRWGEVPVARA